MTWQRPENELQFTLWELFVFVTCVSVFAAVACAAGLFVAVLMSSTVLIRWVVGHFDVDNLLLAALLGASAAFAIAVCAAFVTQPSRAGLLAAWLLFPVIGYVIGILTAFSRQFRST